MLTLACSIGGVWQKCDPSKSTCGGTGCACSYPSYYGTYPYCTGTRLAVCEGVGEGLRVNVRGLTCEPPMNVHVGVKHSV